MAEGLLVRFYKDAVYLKKKSEQTGKPEYEDRVFVSIIPIGDNKTEVIREATDSDKEKYPQEWDRYQRGEEQMYSGTPLKEWPGMQPSTIRMLEHFNIFVVEQLAELSDGSLTHIGPGARELREKAKAYVAKARDEAATQQYAAENERLRSEIEALKVNFGELAGADERMAEAQARIRELEGEIETLTAPEPKKGARKPRDEAAGAAA